MSRSIPCPKCGSSSTHISIEKALYIGQPPDQIFSCTMCGKRVYGVDAVLALVTAHESKLHDLRAAAKAAEKAAAEKAAAEKAAAEKAAAAALAAQEKCAWPGCPNSRTTTSKYCSRTCNVKNAHARAKARKEAQTATAPR